MQAEIKLDTDATVVAFADDTVGSQVRTRDVAEAKALLDPAKAGEAFMVESDDPKLRHLQLYVDEPVPPEIEETSSARTGSFLLRVPSGKLSLVGLGTASAKPSETPETRTLDIPPGDYALSLLDATDKDISAVTAQQKALVSEADWRLYEWINHFGASGCLFIGLGMLFVLIPYTRREYWYLLPLFLMPTCAFVILRHLPGYARVSKRCRQHADSLPQVIISLKRVESTEGLEGGWYRCKLDA